METVLEINNLKKKYGRQEVLKGISLEVKAGEVVGFIGPNGSGKTTTFKIITGLIKADEGEIKIAGIDVNKHLYRALDKVSAIIEGPSLYLEMSGLDNLKMQGQLRGADKEAINKMVEYLNYGKAIRKPVRTYSLGMKQKLQLAICLLARPQLLLLDEPTNGLDPSGSAEFRRQVKEMAHKENMAVLISSHMLHELEETCDRFLFLKDGKIVENDRPEKLWNYRLKGEELSALAKRLAKERSVVNLKGNDHELLVSFYDRSFLNCLIRMIYEEKALIEEFKEESETIEDQYAEIYR